MNLRSNGPSDYRAVTCDDDIVEDLHHFLFECKALRCIRQELFEKTETVIKLFHSSGSRVFRATALSKAAVLDQRLLS